jgi:predicted Zn-dependent peptidase
MSRRRLLGFFKQVYAPSNMLIVAAGNLTHGRVSRCVRKAFAGLAGRRRRRTSPVKPKFRASISLRDKPELEQLHVLLGLPAFPSTQARRYGLHVLNTILGGTMSSRLFQRIREERGLAYSVYSALNLFSDSGVLALYAGTSPSRGREVIDLIMTELRSLADDGPSEAEVHVAKENLKGSLMLALESTSSRMSNLARQEIYFGRQVGPAETLAGIDQVTRTQLRRLARDLFRGRRLGLAAVGRVAELDIAARELVV